jgi:CO/xanthine dehydrogenase Mo-binding subunit
MTYPYGLHAAVVSIDRGTGNLTIERFIVGYDVGRALNPMLVEGQIAGGVAQGIGGALLEEFSYDELGQPLSGTLADYLLPLATDIPEIVVEHIESPSPFTPFGLKGAGEAGIAGPAAAIASAVENAVGGSLCRELVATPLTPWAVLAAIDAEYSE